MPKIKPVKKTVRPVPPGESLPPTSEPTLSVPASFAALAQAVVLASLAHAKGMTVEGVCSLPKFLIDARLPENPSANVRRHAHQLYRDRIDAVLFRANWVGRTNEPPPELTQQEVDEVVESSAPAYVKVF